MRLGGNSDRVTLFSGLYTHKAIREDVNRIPILREKLDQVLGAESAVSGSHLERKLEEAFRTVPVEYLFGADPSSIRKVLRVVISDMADFERLHNEALTRLPGVARVNSSVAIRTVRKTTELPLVN